MIPIGHILARLRSQGLLAAPDPRVDVAVTGISDDSREVQAGDLYCAIRGLVHDGHRFLADAAAAGAVAALVEDPQAGLDLLQIQVSDTRRAAAIAAQVVFGEPAAGLRLVGVTGTNGKTTVVHLARHILSQRLASASIGTLGVVTASDVREVTQLTTPAAVDFARLLAELKEAGVECVVVEVSSHALSQRRVDGVSIEVGVLTNLSRDHLDYHTDFEDYRATKWRLAELVANHGALVINADEPAWRGLPARGRQIRYGLQAEAEYAARDVSLGPWGSRWTLIGPGERAAVELPLLGEFNVENALAAAAAASVIGLDLGTVAEALATVPSVPGRLEVLARAPLILRDYAHTPAALRRVLAALRPLVKGRLIVVFGCGGDRDRGKRPLMGQAAAEGADYTIVSSDNPRTEPPEAIIAEILPGLGSAPYERIADRREAIARAIEIAEGEDAVLLAGKGHETYQVVGEGRRPFDEAVIVNELLSQGQGKA